MDTVLFRRPLATINCVYKVFDWYFLLRYIVISKEHLQPYMWLVPSLFQEATYNDLVFSRVLCFFETSTCSHPFFQRYWVNSQFQLQPSIRWMALFLLQKSNCSHSFFQIYCVFADKNWDIINNNFDTSLASGIHILKEVCYMTT